jgi:hypothetical protein
MTRFAPIEGMALPYLELFAKNTGMVMRMIIDALTAVLVEGRGAKSSHARGRIINLFVVCLLSFNLMSPAWAEEWVEVSKSAAYKVYIDKTAIARDKEGLVTYSMKMEFAKPVKSKRMPAYTSRVVDFVANCKTGTVSIAGGRLFYEGNAVSETPAESRFLTPNVYGMNAFVYACHKARLDSIVSSLGPKAEPAQPGLVNPGRQTQTQTDANLWLAIAIIFACITWILWIRSRPLPLELRPPEHIPMWSGTLYYALDVARKAVDEQILTAYQKHKELLDAREHKDAETINKLITIQYAKEVLLDPKKRAAYNKRIGY